MWINVPEGLATVTESIREHPEQASDVSIKNVLGEYMYLINDARRIEAERKEREDKYSKPVVPMDVPEPVWNAVANLYPDQTEHGWTPAPNHHVEYRDCRTAYIATLRFWAVRLNEQIAGYIDRDLAPALPVDPGD